MKLAVGTDFVEPTAQLVNMALENMQDQAERILLQTFPGVTHEAVMAAQRAMS